MCLVCVSLVLLICTLAMLKTCITMLTSPLTDHLVRFGPATEASGTRNGRMIVFFLAYKPLLPGTSHILHRILMVPALLLQLLDLP
jgi:hypothetical protein